MIVEETIFFDQKRRERFRRFSTLAGIYCRGYSLPLQRAVSDFGADHAFNKVGNKLKEHYGIEVATESARKMTERHAQVMRQKEALINEALSKGKEPQKASIIGEVDGSMVPIVEFKTPSEEGDIFDKRKHKTHCYCEAKLSLAHA